MPLADQLSNLASMPQQGQTPQTPQASQPSQGMGGPGIDTQQEQQAVQLLTQSAALMREAANIDPSIQYIVDKILMDGFNAVTKHYGVEEEGKLALQQAMLEKRKADTLRRAGPPGQGTGGPPGPPMATPPSSMEEV